MNTMLDLGRAVLAQQPFSALMGAELVAYEANRAILELPLRPELLQQNGFAHGGVLCYLADNALTFAGGSALGSAVVTSEFKINYLRPALGERLCAEASVVHAGRSQAVVRCEIFAAQGAQRKLCAAAQGTITHLAEPRKRG
ncbi:Thioesterase superfamily protein [Thiomonas sp. X19]|uniref:PaaI family thioesterase n=1 Tax=Thiomonas sp. X19 TaxID=1050370 RepID=UPI000B74C5ED|nr:PaaI family thioesterase [Thiomonas sp. X19]SCC92168.1 Thioesterase superfamily protein [Thiomonas sp. X19]